MAAAGIVYEITTVYKTVDLSSGPLNRYADATKRAGAGTRGFLGDLTRLGGSSRYAAAAMGPLAVAATVAAAAGAIAARTYANLRARSSRRPTSSVPRSTSRRSSARIRSRTSTARWGLAVPGSRPGARRREAPRRLLGLPRHCEGDHDPDPPRRRKPGGRCPRSPRAGSRSQARCSARVRVRSRARRSGCWSAARSAAIRSSRCSEAPAPRWETRRASRRWGSRSDSGP